MIQPMPGKLIIEPYLHSEALAADVKKRSGLLIEPRHDNKSSFEGIPNQGYIYALPPAYSGELKQGMLIVFDEKSPKGFVYDDRKLLAINLDQVVAIFGAAA